MVRIHIFHVSMFIQLTLTSSQSTLLQESIELSISLEVKSREKAR